MAKYDVTFSCGHTERIELFGKGKDRMHKIEHYQDKGICSHCYREKINTKNLQGCNEVEMHYSKYKNEFSECKTKSGSYNASTKTIVVFVPTNN